MLPPRCPAPVPLLCISPGSDRLVICPAPVFIAKAAELAGQGIFDVPDGYQARFPNWCTGCGICALSKLHWCLALGVCPHGGLQDMLARWTS